MLLALPHTEHTPKLREGVALPWLCLRLGLSTYQVTKLLQDCIHSSLILCDWNDGQAMQTAMESALQALLLCKLAHSLVDLGQASLLMLLA